MAPPCFFRSGAAARQQKKTESRLAPRIVCHSSSEQLVRPRKPRRGPERRSCAVISQLPPTQLTRTCASFREANAFSTADQLETSHLMHRQPGREEKPSS